MQVVGNHAEADPPLHSAVALVETSSEAVSPLKDTDAALTTGPPFLSLLEPPFLLFPLAFGALCIAARDADPLDASLMRRGFILR